MKTKKGEKDRLRDAILDSAIAYFKEHGSSASGTAGLMKHAGLTTGALYSHFRSKDELFAAAVCREFEKIEQRLQQVLQQEKRGALKALIEMYFAPEHLTEAGNSCVFTALGADMFRSEASCRARFESYVDKVFGILADCLQLQFPGDTPQQCREKAMMVYSAMVGAMTMARATSNPAMAQAILAAQQRHLLEHFVITDGH